VSLVWYVGYGSNLSRERMGHYLAGGRPEGAARTYPGCRDTSPPVESRAVWLTGEVVFAWDSPTWGGGVAFLDPTGPGRAPGLAHLITAGQFADVAAQEMRRDPGEDLDLTDVLRDGRHEMGPGRYETLHLLGELDGHPMLTFSASDASRLPRNPPTAPYLRRMADGLRESHGMDEDAIATYLATRPGADGWSVEEVREAIGTSVGDRRRG
jgi:hypothetical protein